MAEVFDVNDWWGGLKSRYNISDEDSAKFSEVEKGFLRQDEFNRKLNKLDDEHKKRMKTEDDFKTELLAAEQTLMSKKQKLDLVDQLESRYGPMEEWSSQLLTAVGDEFPQLTDGAGRNKILNDVKKMITDAVEPLQRQVKGVGDGTGLLVDFMTKAPKRWEKTYGKDFPEEEFGKFFTDFAKRTGITNPFLALKEFEEPIKDQHVKDQHKKDLERVADEARASERSKHGIIESPVSPSSKTVFQLSDEAKRRPDPENKLDRHEVRDDGAVPREERSRRVGGAYFKALDDANSGKVPGVTPGS